MFKTHFDRFVIEGDSISCEVDDIEYRARLEHDWDSHPDDSDCYGPQQVTRWKEDDWHFFTLVISAHAEGVELGDYLACLSGLEGNLNREGKKLLRDVANELLDEAVSEAVGVLNKLQALEVAA